MPNFTPEQIEQFLEEFFDVVGRRQYVGARYVPIFGRKDESSIEWDNSAPYEPLTIVLYQGNSYTSRTYVPTGIDIGNTTYWANTGNYNAQIEQYRTEVVALDGRTTQNENDISDIKAEIPSSEFDAENTVKDYIDDSVENIDEQLSTINEILSNDIEVDGLYINGSCTIVRVENKTIMIDCGSTQDATNITNELDRLEVSKLDYVIISHFHDDHCGSYASVIPYCDSSTKWYRCMDCTDTDNDWYNNALQYINEINSALAIAGIDQMIIPTNGQKINIKTDAFIQFYNTNPLYENIYKVSQKEYEPNVYPGNEGKPSYNNYSLITRIQNGDNSYLDCGDIETAAQKLNCKDMCKTTIMKNPHHMANIMGYWKFFSTCNPDIIYYNIYLNLMDSQPDFTDFGLQWCYTYRYINQIKDIPVYTNFKTDFACEISDYTKVTSGYYIDFINGNDDFTFSTLTVRGAFPPAIKCYDNPNKILEANLITMREWLQIIQINKDIFADTQSEYYGNATFMNEIKTIFNSNSIEAFISKKDGDMCITKPITVGRYTSVVIYSTFNVNDYPNTGCRILTEQTSRTPHAQTFSTPLGVDSSTSLLDKGVNQYFFTNDLLIVKLDNNVLVPCVRSSGNKFSGIVAGGAPSVAPALYIVTIDNYRLTACCAFGLNDSGFSQRTIAEIQNPYNF